MDEGEHVKGFEQGIVSSSASNYTPPPIQNTLYCLVDSMEGNICFLREIYLFW